MWACGYDTRGKINDNVCLQEHGTATGGTAGIMLMMLMMMMIGVAAGGG